MLKLPIFGNTLRIEMEQTCRYGNPCAILVVEADVEIANCVKAGIDKYEPGCFVMETATSLSQSVAKLREIHYDAVLIALDLPDSTGVSTIKGLRSVVPDISPIIALTDLEDAEVEIAAFSAGVSDYINKPFDVKQTLRIIRHSVLRRRRIVADRLALLEEAAVLKSIEPLVQGEPGVLLREAASDVLRVAMSMQKYD